MDQNELIKSRLSDITNILITNGTLVECPGLLYGKTGIAIFFFQLAHSSGNRLFQDYAMDLLEVTSNN